MDHNYGNSREVLVKEFHEKFGAAIQEEATTKLVALRARLIEEEARELIEALDMIGSTLSCGNIPTKEMWILALDGMADLQVVLSGTAVVIKELRNFDEAFRRVHESNMSKLGLDGKPILRDDGKILKGPNYQPPILSDLV